MVQSYRDSRSGQAPRTGCGCGGSRAPIPLYTLGLDQNLNKINNAKVYSPSLRGAVANKSVDLNKIKSVITYQTRIPHNNDLNKDINMKVKESKISIKPNVSVEVKKTDNKKEYEKYLNLTGKVNPYYRGITRENSYNKSKI